jgi:hypothetical protein
MSRRYAPGDAERQFGADPDRPPEAASSGRLQSRVPGFGIVREAVADRLWGRILFLFGDVNPPGERGLNGRHLVIRGPTCCHPGDKAARGPTHEHITLRSVWHAYQWGASDLSGE